MGVGALLFILVGLYFGHRLNKVLRRGKEMKFSDLTHNQLDTIANSYPFWMAAHSPDWMARNRPDWMADNRPDLMAAYSPDLIVDAELPSEIESLIQGTQK